MNEEEERDINERLTRFKVLISYGTYYSLRIVKINNVT